MQKGYKLLVALSFLTWALSLTLFSALPQHNDNGALPIQLAEHRTRQEARMRAQNQGLAKQAALAAQAVRPPVQPAHSSQSSSDDVKTPPVATPAKPHSSAVPIPAPIEKQSAPAASPPASAPPTPPAKMSGEPDAPREPAGISKVSAKPASAKSGELAVPVAEVLSEVPPPPPNVKGAFQASTTAIVVLACKRVHYLEQTMAGLLALSGINRYHLFISQDGTDSGVRGYAQDLTRRNTFIKYLNNDMRREQRQGDQQVASMQYISDHYKFVLTSVFERIADINHAILIEEDMVVSPDFLTLFETTAPLLDSDPSLMCVSSWNDNGYKHMDLDSKRLMRTGFFPGLGWMLRKELWTTELSAKWPQHPTTGWDHWMRVDDQSKGRECIVPELSRNHNIGAQGATVSQRDFEERLGQIAFSRDAATDFGDLGYLRPDKYEADLRAKLLQATPLRVGSPMGSAGSRSVYRIGFLREEWRNLAKALGAYVSNLPRVHFKHVIVLHRNTNTYLLYDRRRSPLAPDGDRLLPPDDLVPVAAQQGVNCLDTCRKLGKRCERAWFDYINTCSHLKKAFSCAPHGCGYEVGEDIPVFVSDVSHPVFGTCLVTDAISTCEAKHKSTSRLCPCAA